MKKKFESYGDYFHENKNIKFKTMKNIHLIPTDKDSKLYLGNLGKAVTIQSASAQFKKPLHIYITNSEEIKEGGWYLDSLVHPSLITEPLQHSGVLYSNNKIIQSTIGTTSPISTSRKIILTTDQDLIKDGVQAIDDEFLEWFVNNSSCEFVETQLVKFEVDMGLGDECIEYGSYYNIMIPKEEPEQKYEYIGECKGNNNNGCFLDSLGHNCGCFIRVPQETPEEVYLENIQEYAEQNLHHKETLKEAINRLIELNRQDAFYEGAKYQAEKDKTILEQAINLLKTTTEYEVLDSFKQKVKELENLI